VGNRMTSQIALWIALVAVPQHQEATKNNEATASIEFRIACQRVVNNLAKADYSFLEHTATNRAIFVVDRTYAFSRPVGWRELRFRLTRDDHRKGRLQKVLRTVP
jgi:hypothetical protein